MTCSSMLLTTFCRCKRTDSYGNNIAVYSQLMTIHGNQLALNIDTRAIKLGVGYCFFQSEKEIERSLYPVAPYVHKILAVDGRFSFYDAGPSNSNFSTDSSVRLIEKLPNAQVFYYTGFEPFKRQVYLDNANDCDFLFVLDTDEYIHPDYQDWNLFYKSLEGLSNKYKDIHLFGVNMFFDENYEKVFNSNLVQLGQYSSLMRIIRNPSELMYDITHYAIVKKGDKKHNWLSLSGPHWEDTHSAFF